MVSQERQPDGSPACSLLSDAANSARGPAGMMAPQLAVVVSEPLSWCPPNTRAMAGLTRGLRVITSDMRGGGEVGLRPQRDCVLGQKWGTRSIWRVGEGKGKSVQRLGE